MQHVRRDHDVRAARRKTLASGGRVMSSAWPSTPKRRTGGDEHRRDVG